MVFYIDCDGTIMDVKKRHYLFFCMFLLLMKCHDVSISADQFWEKKRSGLSDVDIAKSLDVHIEEVLYFESKKRLIESKVLLAEDRVFDFTKRVLTKLSEFATLILFSHRNDYPKFLSQLRALSLDKYFTKVCFANQKIVAKDKLIAEDVLLHRNERQVIIGDTEADYNAALSLGIDCVLVSSGSRNPSFLNNVCHDARVIYDNIERYSETLVRCA